MEAVEAVVATCNLGLEHVLETVTTSELDGAPLRAVELLARERVDKMFRVGWRLLYTQVSLAAASALERALARKRREIADPELGAELAKLAVASRSAVADGKPWRVRGSLEILRSVFDGDTVAALEPLLDEYPRMWSPAHVRSGATERPSPSKLQLIPTREQLRSARRFLRNLRW